MIRKNKNIIVLIAIASIAWVFFFNRKKELEALNVIEIKGGHETGGSYPVINAPDPSGGLNPLQKKPVISVLPISNGYSTGEKADFESLGGGISEKIVVNNRILKELL